MPGASERLLFTVEVCGAEPGRPAACSTLSAAPPDRAMSRHRSSGRLHHDRHHPRGPPAAVRPRGPHRRARPHPARRRRRPARPRDRGRRPRHHRPSPHRRRRVVDRRPPPAAVPGQLPYPDYGLTLDAVIAMDAAGAGQDNASAATTFVADQVETTSPTPTRRTRLSSTTSPTPRRRRCSSRSSRARTPPTSGGTDLVARLQSLMTAEGQFATPSPFGQYANTIGQSFGVLGLQRVGAGPDPARVDFLRGVQCPDGGFPLTPTAPGGTSPATPTPRRSPPRPCSRSAAPTTSTARRP